MGNVDQPEREDFIRQTSLRINHPSEDIAQAIQYKHPTQSTKSTEHSITMRWLDRGIKIKIKQDDINIKTNQRVVSWGWPSDLRRGEVISMCVDLSEEFF